MSASDEILNRLVVATRQTGPSFWKAWEPAGEGFRLKVLDEVFSRVWANAVLQEIHPGADLGVWP